MTSNFQFLKSINNNLYEIIVDAEKLYKDEYFEQCMTQTRRFGEQICKIMLEQNNKQTGSFDEMLATLKEYSHGHEQEKEFIDDLYFLKKNGNQSVHSGKVKKDGIIALECLQRAFEVAINYSVYNQGAPANILKLNYDIELLVTNKKSKVSLKEKYEQEKAKQKLQKEVIKKKEEKKVTFDKRKTNNTSKENNKRKDKKNIKISLYWKFIIFLSFISVSSILFLTIAILIKN